MNKTGSPMSAPCTDRKEIRTELFTLFSWRVPHLFGLCQRDVHELVEALGVSKLRTHNNLAFQAEVDVVI